MVVALVIFSPAIFAAPGPPTTSYLAMVFHIVPPPTIAPTATAPIFLPNSTNTPTPTRTPTPILAPGVATPTPTRNPHVCAAEYPTVCIPPPPPDLNCPDITFRNFTVLPPDRHHFDTDHDGIGCEQN